MNEINFMVPSYEQFTITETGHLEVDSHIDVLEHLRSLLPKTVQRFKVCVCVWLLLGFVCEGTSFFLFLLLKSLIFCFFFFFLFFFPQFSFLYNKGATCTI
jgi:hypothetical protein